MLFSEDTLLLHGTDQENSSAAPQTRQMPRGSRRQFFHPADIDIAKQRFLLPAEGRQFDRSFSFHQRVYQVIFSLPRQMGNDNSFTQLLLLMLPAEPAFALLPFRCLRKLPRAESCMQTAAVQPRHHLQNASITSSGFRFETLPVESCIQTPLFFAFIS